MSSRAIANPPPPPPQEELWLDVTLPVTKLGLGPWLVDPVKAALGFTLGEVLEPLLREPARRRPSASGTSVEVHPIAIPEGEGLVLPLQQWGEVGFKNRRGYLILTMPVGAKSWLVERFGDAIVQGPLEGPSSDRSCRVVHAAIRLRRGMKASYNLGMLGEVGIEAG